MQILKKNLQLLQILHESTDTYVPTLKGAA